MGFGHDGTRGNEVKKKTIKVSDFSASDYKAVHSWLVSQIHDMLVDEEFMEDHGENILPQLRGLCDYLKE